MVGFDRLAEAAGPIGEGCGVGAGVVEADVGAGGFGGEPFGAGGDDDSACLAVVEQAGEVGVVGQTGPEVQPAGGDVFDVGLGGVLGEAAQQQVPASLELVAEPAQVGLPPGVGDDVQGGGLEQPGDVDGFGGAVGEDAFVGGAAGDDRSDAQGGGDALGQRPEVDDVPGVLPGGQGGRA